MADCGHSHITVPPLWSEGLCNDCGAVVAMESIPYPNAPKFPPGNRFYWQKTKPEDRTEAHPANDPAFYEAKPGWWELRDGG